MDDEEANVIALGVFLEIAEVFEQDVDNGFVEFEDLCEFINTTDRNALSRILREDASSSDEAAAVLGSQTDLARDVFFKLREACGGVEMIGIDPEKEAEIEALSTILGDMTSEELPPIDDLTATEVTVDEPKLRITNAEVRDWLSDVQPQRFCSAWGSVPSIYEDEIRNLVEVSTESELIFGSSVMEIITEELVNTHPTSVPSPTVRHWLNSIAQTNSVGIHESVDDIPFSLIIFDDYVIAGYFAREGSAQGAFLRTADLEVYDWALRVFEKWQTRSRELDIPIRFRGENPYLEDRN